MHTVKVTLLYEYFYKFWQMYTIMKPTQAQHKTFPLPKKMSPCVSYQLINSHLLPPNPDNPVFCPYSFDLSTTGWHIDLWVQENQTAKTILSYGAKGLLLFDISFPCIMNILPRLSFPVIPFSKLSFFPCHYYSELFILTE